MTILVLPDHPGPFGLAAAATLLVAAAALAGALAPFAGRWLAQRLPPPANDNEEGFAIPRARIRGV